MSEIVNDDRYDEPRRLEKCAIADCPRLTDGGLYCRRHRAAFARSDVEHDEQPDPPRRAA